MPIGVTLGIFDFDGVIKGNLIVVTLTHRYTLIYIKGDLIQMKANYIEEEMHKLGHGVLWEGGVGGFPPHKN